LNKEELLANAEKPAEEAMKLHPFYQGKVEVTLKAAVHDYHDFAVWYTPGVAAPCRAIQARKENVAAEFRRYQFGGYCQPQMFLHPGAAAPGVPYPCVA